MLVEVDDEVLLALQLPGELIGVHHTQGALLAWLIWILFHAVIVRIF